MGLPNTEVLYQTLDQLIFNKYGLLDSRELEAKRGEFLTDFLSYLLHNYVKGFNAETKTKILELERDVSPEEFVTKLLEDLTKHKRLLVELSKDYFNQLN
jgi:glutamine synthetase type III